MLVATRAFHACELQPVDVAAIRIGLRTSQSEFAAMVGVSESMVRNWEQGRRVPHGPALARLRIAARDPHGVAHALRDRRGRGLIQPLLRGFSTASSWTRQVREPLQLAKCGHLLPCINAQRASSCARFHRCLRRPASGGILVPS